MLLQLFKLTDFIIMRVFLLQFFLQPVAFFPGRSDTLLQLPCFFLHIHNFRFQRFNLVIETRVLLVIFQRTQLLADFRLQLMEFRPVSLLQFFQPVFKVDKTFRLE